MERQVKNLLHEPVLIKRLLLVGLVVPTSMSITLEAARARAFGRLFVGEVPTPSFGGGVFGARGFTRSDFLRHLVVDYYD
jgi:hypothetical protein